MKRLFWQLVMALSFLIVISVISCSANPSVEPIETPTETETLSPTETPTETLAPSETATDTPAPIETETPTETFSPTDTPSPTETPTPTLTPVPVQPFIGAPLCSSHDTAEFHTLWNFAGCHYDHEHGTNPFTNDVAETFPGFDLFVLLGNVEIGSTNPSSPMENTHKHGGMKWDVMLTNPHGCVGGFENATYCIKSVVIQYHNFGDYSMEMGARIHSAAALLKVCNPATPSDCGYMFTVQHEEFGQRISPYQGTVIQYPDNPSPAYAVNFGQYFSVDCLYMGLPGCRNSLTQIRNSNINTNSVWTSKPTGTGAKPPGSTILQILFRVRDVYQVFDSRDLTYPFTFVWVCTTDNGATFTPISGCRWNNSTSKVHEVGGVIPSIWDNFTGFDTNPTVGRITAEGYTDRFGVLSPACTEPGGNCFPIKLVNMFVGKYGDYLTAAKVSNPSPSSNPERDIYFCNGIVCSETSTGAQPSGWIGEGN